MTLCHEVPARRTKGHYCAKTGRIIVAGFLCRIERSFYLNEKAAGEVFRMKLMVTAVVIDGLRFKNGRIVLTLGMNNEKAQFLVQNHSGIVK